MQSKEQMDAHFAANYPNIKWRPSSAHDWTDKDGENLGTANLPQLTSQNKHLPVLSNSSTDCEALYEWDGNQWVLLSDSCDGTGRAPIPPSDNRPMRRGIQIIKPC